MFHSLIVYITAVAQGVQDAEGRSHHTGGGEGLATGIVGIFLARAEVGGRLIPPTGFADDI